MKYILTYEAKKGEHTYIEFDPIHLSISLDPNIYSDANIKKKLIQILTENDIKVEILKDVESRGVMAPYRICVRIQNVTTYVTSDRYFYEKLWNIDYGRILYALSEISEKALMFSDKEDKYEVTRKAIDQVCELFISQNPYNIENIKQYLSDNLKKKYAYLFKIKKFGL